jgi:hypothetical protein
MSSSEWDGLVSEPLLHADWGQAPKKPSKFRALFSTPLGQEVLQEIKAKTIDRPVAQVTGCDGLGMALLAFRREGENDLCRWILRQIDNSEKLGVEV